MSSLKGAYKGFYDFYNDVGGLVTDIANLGGSITGAVNIVMGLGNQLNGIVAHSDEDDDGEFSMTMTEAGVKRVRVMMANEGKEDHVLRVRVIPGGCSGYSYDMQFAEKAEENDILVNQFDLDIYVDFDSQKLLNNIEIDYVDTLNDSGFKYRNPNASASCGCGLSFN